MRTLTTILLSFLVGLTASAQMKIAQIDDKDGYTNIRTGQGTDFEIAGTVEKDDFFYCEVSDTSDWYKVIGLKWSKGDQLTGYIHKSRITLIEQLPQTDQKTIIENTLQEHKQLAAAFVSSVSKYDRTKEKWDSVQDSLDYKRTVGELETHSDIKYDLILQVLPNFFCKSKDESTIQLFFDVMWADRGSANEMPSFTIGDCFICEPDLIIDLLQQPDNQDKKQDIINHIDWGLINHFSIDENAETRNQEYLNLKKKLEKIK